MTAVGNDMLSGSRDGIVMLWCALTKQCLAEIKVSP